MDCKRHVGGLGDRGGSLGDMLSSLDRGMRIRLVILAVLVIAVVIVWSDVLITHGNSGEAQIDDSVVRALSP